MSLKRGRSLPAQSAGASRRRFARIDSQADAIGSAVPDSAFRAALAAGVCTRVSPPLLRRSSRRLFRRKIPPCGESPDSPPSTVILLYLSARDSPGRKRRFRKPIRVGQGVKKPSQKIMWVDLGKVAQFCGFSEKINLFSNLQNAGRESRGNPQVFARALSGREKQVGRSSAGSFGGLERLSRAR
jgi:hypothetical protein